MSHKLRSTSRTLHPLRREPSRRDGGRRISTASASTSRLTAATAPAAPASAASVRRIRRWRLHRGRALRRRRRRGLGARCQMRPKTDLVVDIFASSEVCKTKGAGLPGPPQVGWSGSPDHHRLHVEGAGALSFLPASSHARWAGTDARLLPFSSPPSAETQSSWCATSRTA